MTTYDLTKSPLPGFEWHNEPASHAFGPDGLEIVTGEKTDFWQRPHEGHPPRQRPFLFHQVRRRLRPYRDPSRSSPRFQYDQCGLMVRVDAENWIKCSLEYENASFGRLGSVVTNHGHSDWATHDVAATIHEITYRIRRTGAGLP